LDPGTQQPFPFAVIQLADGDWLPPAQLLGEGTIAGLAARTNGVPACSGPDALDSSYFRSAGSAVQSDFLLPNLFPFQRVKVVAHHRSCLVVHCTPGGLTGEKLLGQYIMGAVTVAVRARALWFAAISLGQILEREITEMAGAQLHVLASPSPMPEDDAFRFLGKIAELRARRALCLCDSTEASESLGSYAKLARATRDAFGTDEILQANAQKLEALERLYADCREGSSMKVIRSLMSSDRGKRQEGP
jgi:hypothetical protein